MQAHLKTDQAFRQEERISFLTKMKGVIESQSQSLDVLRFLLQELLILFKQLFRQQILFFLSSFISTSFLFQGREGEAWESRKWESDRGMKKESKGGMLTFEALLSISI